LPAAGWSVQYGGVTATVRPLAAGALTADRKSVV
jgi:hypothetical protein